MEDSFFIGLFGTIAIFPFVSNEIVPALSQPNTILLMILAGLVTFFAALFDFEALKLGKLAIIEPIISLELPVTVVLSILFGGEILNFTEILIILIIFIGIAFAVTEHHNYLHYHRRIFEKGVIIAGLGAVGMALVNFLTGRASQETSPLLAIWFIWTFFTILCFLYLLLKREIKSTFLDFRYHFRLIVIMSFLDTAAWIFFAFAVRYIPISIATAISESYIALAAFLGIFANRERLKNHQATGIAVTVAGVILLSYITG